MLRSKVTHQVQLPSGKQQSRYNTRLSGNQSELISSVALKLNLSVSLLQLWIVTDCCYSDTERHHL